MIYAFEFKASDVCIWMLSDDPVKMQAMRDRVSNGFCLFGKYYEALWD